MHMESWFFYMCLFWPILFYFLKYLNASFQLQILSSNLKFLMILFPHFLKKQILIFVYKIDPPKKINFNLIKNLNLKKLAIFGLQWSAKIQTSLDFGQAPLVRQLFWFEPIKRQNPNHSGNWTKISVWNRNDNRSNVWSSPS